MYVVGISSRASCVPYTIDTKLSISNESDPGSRSSNISQWHWTHTAARTSNHRFPIAILPCTEWSARGSKCRRQGRQRRQPLGELVTGTAQLSLFLSSLAVFKFFHGLGPLSTLFKFHSPTHHASHDVRLSFVEMHASVVHALLLPIAASVLKSSRSGFESRVRTRNFF